MAVLNESDKFPMLFLSMKNFVINDGKRKKEIFTNTVKNLTNKDGKIANIVLKQKIIKKNNLRSLKLSWVDVFMFKIPLCNYHAGINKTCYIKKTPLYVG